MEETIQPPVKRPATFGYLLVGILIGLVVGFGGYYAWTHRTKSVTVSTTPSGTSSTTVSTNKTFNDSNYHFSFSYPEKYSVITKASDGAPMFGVSEPIALTTDKSITYQPQEGCVGTYSVWYMVSDGAATTYKLASVGGSGTVVDKITMAGKPAIHRTGTVNGEDMAPEGTKIDEYYIDLDGKGYLKAGMCNLKEQGDAAELKAIVDSIIISTTKEATVPSGWKTMANSVGHYSLAYPADWQVSTLNGTTPETTTASMTILESPSTVKLMDSGDTTAFPDIRISYVDNVGLLEAMDANTGETLSGYKTLSSYVAALHANNTGIGKTEARTIGVYSGYFTDEMPGIGGMNNLFIESNGHVYDISYSGEYTTTIQQIVNTFRVIK